MLGCKTPGGFLFVMFDLIIPILGVDHLIFDGGVVQIPKKISSMFLVKKKFFAEFLRRKKKSSSLINLGVAKDFA